MLYSRPGYGAPRRTRAAGSAGAAADLAAVLDGLGVAEFVTVGWSGGGPHALACAALLPGRCLAAATMAGVAPYQAEGLDWLHGMGGAEHRGVPGGPGRAGGADRIPGARGAGDGHDDRRRTWWQGSATWRRQRTQAAVTGEFADYLAASFRAAVAAGVAGWRDDDLAFTTRLGLHHGRGGRMALPWRSGRATRT